MYYTIEKFISEGRSIPIKARNTFRKDYLDFPDQENWKDYLNSQEYKIFNSSPQRRLRNAKSCTRSCGFN